MTNAFYARRGSAVTNVTGDATDYLIVFDSTSDYYNYGSQYSVSTGLFTAPSDGYYLFDYYVTLGNLTAPVGDIFTRFVKNSATDVSVNIDSKISADGNSELTVHEIKVLQLSTSDTIGVKVKVSGGTKIVSVLGSTDVRGITSFQGYLL